MVERKEGIKPKKQRKRNKRKREVQVDVIEEKNEFQGCKEKRFSRVKND